jgi:ferritin
MLKKSMQKAINDQINAEIYSSYLYLSMAGHCQANDLNGMANWFRVQAQEELVHVMKFFSYVTDKGGRALLEAVAKPPGDWTSPQDLFQNVLAHEESVTARINKLLEQAAKENDHTTVTFLQWFVNEQIEEEASVRQIIGQLKLMGDSGQGIYLLDRELATRIFVMPVTGP